MRRCTIRRTPAAASRGIACTTSEDSRTAVVYAVYGAPDLADDAVMRVAEERDYARRFSATVGAAAV